MEGTDTGLVIRRLTEADGQAFVLGERAQGWHADIAKYLEHLEDQAAGKCETLCAEMDGCPAGYVSVYRGGVEGPLGGKGIPFIEDLGVLQKYQRLGIGSALMDVAEKIAGEWADTVYLAVGLHEGFGRAQRMYVKRGYIPDGTGVWYHGRPCTPYDTVYTNDDDLVLYLVKKL